jgi:metallophosphoesterase (TIGR03768 family)
MTSHTDRNEPDNCPETAGMEVSRRRFLQYSLVVIPAAATVHSGQMFAASMKARPTYPIDPEVFTTLQQRVVPGTKPAVALPLSEVAKFAHYGYGNWSRAGGLAAELRTDLMPAGYHAARRNKKAKLLSFFTISDIHITDKEAPNQMIQTGRLTEAKTAISASLYSPVMMCTTQVLDAAVQTVNALHAKHPIDFGLSLGDVCNSSQYNELRWYIDVLDGKVIHPSSGAHLGAGSIDYQKPFQAAGLNKDIPWYQTLGNHDHFFLGSFPVDNQLRPDLRASYTSDKVFAAGNALDDVRNIKDHTYYMGVIDGSTPFGEIRYAGDRYDFKQQPRVAADRHRHPLAKDAWIKAFFNTTTHPRGHGFSHDNAKTGFACYSFVPKSTLPLKVIVLDDTQREDDGSLDIHGHGFLDGDRWNWLKHELAAGDKAGQLMIIAAHIPLAVEETNPPAAIAGGKKQDSMAWWVNPDPAAAIQNAVTLPALIEELHQHPNLLMWLSGHRHLNTVKAFVGNTPESGFWQVETSSLRDFPQQLRTFELYLNHDYSVSMVTTNVDPAVKEGSPAAKSRRYAIAASQIVKDADKVEDHNKTHDPSIHFMPGGSYNAELLKQLSPQMIKVLHNQFH